MQMFDWRENSICKWRDLSLFGTPPFFDTTSVHTTSPLPHGDDVNIEDNQKLSMKKS